MELSQIDEQVFVQDCPGLALGSFIKRGGQKSVWNCAFLGQSYVLKAIMASDDALSRVRREIQIMQRCDSPYLPKFGPIFLRELVIRTGEKLVYFLEEHIDGVPLLSVRTPAAAEQVVALGRCVGKALMVLAAHRYVHRDVKPLNIMQKTSSTYVLIDAGLALDPDAEAISLVGTLPVGTPAFYSPEQITLPSQALDPRSDLFSLGVTMYWFATGQHPFLNDELPRVDPLRNIVELQPPDPRGFISTLPDQLCAVISKLLEKERGERYQTAEQLLADLTQLS
jgi:serine/threonine protein kinase